VKDHRGKKAEQEIWKFDAADADRALTCGCGLGERTASPG
jgi:hypothetical protein